MTQPLLHRLCAWSAPAGLILTFGGMLTAGWLPPPFPGDDAAVVARYYQDHTDAIRVASILISVGGVLLLPYVAIVSVYLNRIEGARGPLGYLQLTSGVLGPVAFLLPGILWAAAAYDPARSADVTKALHDAAWLGFIAGIWTFAVQNVAVGVAILLDRHERPVLPRWLGYTGVWIALLYVPSCLVIFFHHGPFSWNGIFTFWLAAVAFVAWTLMLVVAIHRAAGDDAQPA